MLDVNKILYEICEDENVFDDEFDLIESRLLDSYSIIELFSYLDDHDVEIQPSQIKIDNLRTPKRIKEMIKKYEKS